MLSVNSHTTSDKQPELFLKTEVNPLKNPFCPYYGECLDRAVDEKWPQFTCQKCVYRGIREAVIKDSRDIAGYYHLLEKVFELK